MLPRMLVVLSVGWELRDHLLKLVGNFFVLV